MTTIETERLILRPHQESDFDGIHEYATDQDVVKFMQWGPNTLDETRFFLDTCIANQKHADRLSYDFAVVSREDGSFLGTVSLRLSSPSARAAELGYTYQKRAWGRGIASEAARRMVDFGFDELGLTRIFATCNPVNYASARVLQKCGLVLEGCMKNHMMVKGVWRDTLLFATTSATRESNLAANQTATNESTHAHSKKVRFSTRLAAGDSLESGTTSMCELVVVLSGTLSLSSEERTPNTLQSPGKEQTLVTGHTPGERLTLAAGQTLYIAPACRRPQYKAVEDSELLIVRGVF
jgi:[ribosomal protein S5]-alanine N-acetyltransferase